MQTVSEPKQKLLMAENFETLATHPEIVKRLQTAFPSYLSKEVESTVINLPAHHLRPSQHDIGSIVISGESIHIPSRFYSPEPITETLAGFSNLNHLHAHRLKFEAGDFVIDVGRHGSRKCLHRG